MMIALTTFTLLRIVFVLVNLSYFDTLNATAFLYGVWFDIVTISLCFLPFILLSLFLPLFVKKPWGQKVLRFVFIFTNSILTVVYLADIAYFPFIHKRLTFDLIRDFFFNEDTLTLSLNFLSDFWFLLLFLIFFIFLSVFLDKKLIRTPSSFNDKLPIWKRGIWSIFLPGLFVLLGRGGTQLRPIGILDAKVYGNGNNATVILNAPFTVLKTINLKGLPKTQFMSIKEEQAFINPIRTSVPLQKLRDSTNVVILILESFGMEFVGFLQDDTVETYTPFLDSLMAQSLVYKYSFANGTRSMEAMPAIIASTPSLMNEAYLSSVYATNKLDALPNTLSKFGYTSAFFHSAKNGSMLFDKFAMLSGFNYYYGQNEYPEQAHHDGGWGIPDDHFNPWVAKQLDTLPQPFLGTLFTLSSHHPYKIPEAWKDHVKYGEQEICAAISYADISLKLFFEQARKCDWYENTLFVLVADHSPNSTTPKYMDRTHLFRIPLAFYHPSVDLAQMDTVTIASQVDIFPTVLDLLNIETSYYSFGSSLFQNTDKYAVSCLWDETFFFKNTQMLSFSSEKAQNLFNFTIDPANWIDPSSQLYVERKHIAERNLQAILQCYRRNLIQNSTAF